MSRVAYIRTYWNPLKSNSGELQLVSESDQLVIEAVEVTPKTSQEEIAKNVFAMVKKAKIDGWEITGIKQGISARKLDRLVRTGKDPADPKPPYVDF